MIKFIARAVGTVAVGVAAAGLAPAALAFATGDADDAASSAEASPATGAPAAVLDVRSAPAPAPAARPVAPSGECHLVWVGMFGPVCMPGA